MESEGVFQMYRFTTDTPKTNMELARNMFYIADHQTVCNIEEGEQITLYDLMRKIGKVLDCKIGYDDTDDSISDDSISEYMYDCLEDGYDSLNGILGCFYTVAWAFAENRERLKAYEDTGLMPNEITALQESNKLNR